MLNRFFKNSDITKIYNGRNIVKTLPIEYLKILNIINIDSVVPKNVFDFLLLNIFIIDSNTILVRPIPKGEYNIFNLPDLSTFDGVVVDCSNIVDKAQLDRVVDMLRTYDVPVISIGYNIEGFYFSSVDNRQPVIEIMDHLYHVHGYRRRHREGL